MSTGPSPTAGDASRARSSAGAEARWPGGASRRRWQELYERGPTFRCSDPYLETLYWYRWSGIWLNAAGNEQVTLHEGIGRAHVPRAADGDVWELGQEIDGLCGDGKEVADRRRVAAEWAFHEGEELRRVKSFREAIALYQEALALWRGRVWMSRRRGWGRSWGFV